MYITRIVAMLSTLVHATGSGRWHIPSSPQPPSRGKMVVDDKQGCFTDLYSIRQKMSTRMMRGLSE